MVLNLLIKYYVLQKLISQDKYKTIKLELKHRNANSQPV